MFFTVFSLFFNGFRTTHNCFPVETTSQCVYYLLLRAARVGQSAAGQRCVGGRHCQSMFVVWFGCWLLIVLVWLLIVDCYCILFDCYIHYLSNRTPIETNPHLHRHWAHSGAKWAAHNSSPTRRKQPSRRLTAAVMTWHRVGDDVALVCLAGDDVALFLWLVFGVCASLCCSTWWWRGTHHSYRLQLMTWQGVSSDDVALIWIVLICALVAYCCWLLLPPGDDVAPSIPIDCNWWRGKVLRVMTWQWMRWRLADLCVLCALVATWNTTSKKTVKKPLKKTSKNY